MATLTNTQISVTYVGLLKTSGNTILDSTPQQITDGSGNNSQLFLSTTKVGVGATPSGSDTLQITGTSSFSSHITLADNAELRVGTSTDLQASHDGTDSFIINNTGDLYIRNNADDKDIIFQCDDGSGGVETYFFLDGSASSGNPFTVFPDLSELAFGTSRDLKIKHDGTDSSINNNTGDLYIKNSADDKDIIFQSDDGSGGVTSYFELDGSDVVTKFRKNLYLLDNVGLKIGNSFDLDIKHDGSDSFIANATGHLYIKNSADDKDIIFQSDDGSGGMATYFFLDGSQADGTYRYIDFPDNSVISLGDNDAAIFHDGTDTRIKNETGDLFISQFANDKDIVFRNDDGSGGVAEYFRLDGGLASGGELKTLFPDNSRIVFGDGADFNFYHDGTDSRIQNTTGHIRIINFADDSDIIFSSDDGSGGTTEYFRVDGGVSYTVASKAFRFLDSVNVQLGDGADFTMQHNGTDTVLQNFTGDLKILNSADDKDIIFQSDDGSGSTATYMTIDGSATKVTLQKDLRADDGVKIQAGSSGDLFMVHESDTSKITNGTGQLQITQNVADEDIVFQADGGSGSAVEYMRLDGSQTSIRMKRQVKWDDNIKATFGNSDDLQIYHDGSNSFIQDSGTGRLNILTNQFRVLNSANSEILIDANENSAVDLYHNNVKKFATTSSGVEVTGFTDGSLADTGAGYNDGVVRFHNTTTATSGGSSVMNIRNSYGAGFGGLIKFWKADTSSSVGNIAFNTDTTAVNYNTTSDYRLKEDLQDFAGIDLIQRMKVYDYKWINYESRSYGVLAHELQEVLPGAVSGEKDDEEMQGVDYSKVVPVLIKAIQELKAEIELLKK